MQRKHTVHISLLYMNLYNLGIREPLLFIAGSIPKLDEEIRKIFPRSDFNYAPYMHQGILNQM